MRFIRLALGVFILIQGIQTGEWLMMIFGAGFTLMPLFNVGCCATGNCSVQQSNSKSSTEEVAYEEIT